MSEEAVDSTKAEVPEPAPKTSGALLPVVVDIEEVLKEVSGIAKLNEIPDGDRAILCLRSYGMTYKSIAAVLGVGEVKIAKVVKTFDPHGTMKASTNLRLAFVKDQLAAIAVEVLANIRAQDIADMSVRNKVDVAKLAVQAIQAIGLREPKRQKSISDVLQNARQVSEEKH